MAETTTKTSTTRTTPTNTNGAEAQNVARELQDQVLEGIRKGQETIVEAVQAWADATHFNAPELPALPKLPFALPKAEDVVAESYDYAAKLLANQREFAENLLKAAEPVLQRRN